MKDGNGGHWYRIANMGTISKHSEDWWIEGACSTTSARLVNFPLFETQTKRNNRRSLRGIKIVLSLP